MELKSNLMEEAVAAGWIPNHVKNLTSLQLRQLLKASTGYPFDYILDKSNRATLVKTATEIYKLNPRLSSKMTIQQLKDFIKTESLYAGEGLTSGPFVEGPYYPGFRAVREINKPDMVFPRPEMVLSDSLYRPPVFASTPSNLTPSEQNVLQSLTI